MFSGFGRRLPPRQAGPHYPSKAAKVTINAVKSTLGL